MDQSIIGKGSFIWKPTDKNFDGKNPSEDPFKNSKRIRDLDILNVQAIPLDLKVSAKVIAIDLYNSVLCRFNDKDVIDSEAKIKVEFVKFVDTSVLDKNAGREYIIVSGHTPRNTNMYLYTTFRDYGSYIYISINSFLEQTLNTPIIKASIMQRLVPSVIVSALVSIFLFMSGIFSQFLLNNIKVGLTQNTLFLPYLLIPCLFIWWKYKELEKSINSEKLKADAQAQSDTNSLFSSTFNIDDISAFYKSVTLVIIEVVQKVYLAYGLVEAKKSLEETFQQNVQNNNIYHNEFHGTVNAPSIGHTGGNNIVNSTTDSKV